MVVAWLDIIVSNALEPLAGSEAAWIGRLVRILAGIQQMRC